MKHMQKLTCLLLALLMLLSLSVTAFAAVSEDPADPPVTTIQNIAEGPEYFDPTDKTGTANGNGSVTVTKANVGEDYSLYQLLYLENYSIPAETADAPLERDLYGNIIGGVYSYKLNSGFDGFLDYSKTITNNNVSALQKVSEYLSINTDSGTVKWVGDATPERAAVIATLALEFAKEHHIQPIATKTAEAPAVEGAVPSVTFSKLKLGYFLVDTTVGSLCSLNTTNSTTTMEDKNVVPSNSKKVRVPGEDWGTANDVEIGTEVEFLSTLTVGQGITHLVFHDKMETGLTLTEASIEVWLDINGDTKVPASETTRERTNYTISYNDKKDKDTKNCTFHIEFTPEYLQTITTGKTLYVHYKATVNQSALITDPDAGENTSRLSYGDKQTTTTDSTTETKTWEIPVLKYTIGSDGRATPLAGAKFRLHYDTSVRAVDEAGIDLLPDTDLITLVPLGTQKFTEKITYADGSIAEKEENYDVYRVATEAEKTAGKATVNGKEVATVTEITTTDKGRFRIQGLDSGAYLLEETYAPSGLDKLGAPAKIEVGSNGEVKYNNRSVALVQILNGRGTKMPSTGGIGTTIFYVVGSVMLVGAAILLITKKRMSAEG